MLDRLLSLLVSDTNIWIDLDNSGMINEVFQLPYKLISPDLAKKELMRPSWQSLQNLGLEFVELEPSLVSEISSLMGSHRSLSSIDLAAFLLARKLKAVLLSGDRHLQQLAVQNGVTTHGSVWILDELIRWEIIAPQKAAETLRKIIEQGARLPAEECNKRFELWG